jgi:hypothetical protein
MRRILLWFLEELGAVFDPRTQELRHLKAGMVRARQRHDHHRALAREASQRVDEAMRRVKALEMSWEADVDELVNARRELVLIETDLRHHRARGRAAQEALRLMKADAKRLGSGQDAEHRDAYLELLNR